MSLSKADLKEAVIATLKEIVSVSEDGTTFETRIEALENFGPLAHHIRKEPQTLEEAARIAVNAYRGPHHAEQMDEAIKNLECFL